jgi:hypothetical protein
MTSEERDVLLDLLDAGQHIRVKFNFGHEAERELPRTIVSPPDERGVMVVTRPDGTGRVETHWKYVEFAK